MQLNKIMRYLGRKLWRIRTNSTFTNCDYKRLCAGNHPGDIGTNRVNILFQFISICPKINKTYFLICLQGDGIHESLRVFQWFLLPRNNIQIYQILLHHSQQPNVILLAELRELNMETCLAVSFLIKILKDVYELYILNCSLYCFFLDAENHLFLLRNFIFYALDGAHIF